MERDADLGAGFVVDGLDVDALDQPPRRFDQAERGGVRAVVPVGQIGLQRGDLVGIALRGARVKLDRRARLGVDLGDLRRQFGLLLLQLGQLAADHPGGDLSGQQGVGAALDRPLDLAQATHQGRPLMYGGGGAAFPLGVIGADVGGDRLRRQQPLAQAGQHPFLDLATSDMPPVRAGRHALFPIAGADEAPRAERGVGSAAAAALHQAGQQPRPAAQVHQLRRIDQPPAFDPGLGLIPQSAVDHGEVGHVDADVLFSRLADGDAAARRAVLSHLDAAEDLGAGVDLAVQDAVGALARPHDGAGVPQTAGRRRDLFAVQLIGDGARGHALFRVHRENPSDDLGLVFDDVDRAPRMGAVAVEARPRRQPLFGVRGHPPLRFLAERPDVVLGHEALPGDVHPLDAVAVERRRDDAGIVQAVHDVRHVFEVAGDPIAVLDQQDVEGAALGRREGGQQARAIGHGLTGYGGVGVHADDGPALGLGMARQDRDLVGDRPLVLAIGGVAGVERGAGHARVRRRPGGDRTDPDSFCGSGAISTGLMLSERLLQRRALARGKS